MNRELSQSALKLLFLPALLTGCMCTDLPPMVDGMSDSDRMKADGRIAQPVSPVRPGIRGRGNFEVRDGELFASRFGGQMVLIQHETRFAFNMAVLPESARTDLRSHANFLRANPDQIITIEGHADERGTREYNLALGDLRARAVSRYLRSQGVSSKQIKTISYGEEKPVDSRSNEQAWEKNRRARIIYQ